MDKKLCLKELVILQKFHDLFFKTRCKVGKSVVAIKYYTDKREVLIQNN